MELASPGLGYDVHHRACALSELRVVVARLHAELLQRVGERERPVDVGHLVHIVAAVQKIIRLVGQGSVRAGHNRGREGLPIALVDPVALVGCVRYPCDQRDERRCISSVQRQIHHAFLVDNLRQCARRRVHLRNRAGHLYRLGSRANRQLRIHGHRLVSLQHDARLIVGLKSRRANRHRIRRRSQRRKHKRARLPGLHHRLPPGAGLRRRDRRPGNRRARRIDHRPHNRAVSLCHQAPGIEHRKKGHQHAGT